MDDERLARLASQGDRDAFAALSERYEAWIYTVAYKNALHEQDAGDIAQNVSLQLVSAIRSYQAPGNFRAWLAVLTSRVAIDFLRQDGRLETSWEADQLEALVNGANHPPPNPREALEAKTLQQRVETAMADLTPQQRAILILRLDEELRPREIAARLEIPPKQVRVQLSRVYAKLRTSLGDVASHYIPHEE